MILISTSWPDVEELRRLFDMLFIQFGDVAQAFDAFLELDEGAEVGHAHDFAFDGHRPDYGG